jgi:ribosome biogenesis GTPase A
MTLARYLVVGRTGNGKSSLINSTFGRHVARTHEFEACTTIVEHHALGTPLGNIVLIDTPGFAEGDHDDDLQRAKTIAEHVSLRDVFAVMYVTRLGETRVRADELRTLRALSRQFGEALWDKAWLVLTFAAEVAPSRRNDFAGARRSLLNEAVIDSLKAQSPLVSFVDFRRCWLIDNVVDDWCDDGVPLAQVLTNQR